MILAAVVPAHAQIPHIDWFEVLARLVVSGALGAFMGLERQIHGRAAGLRTMMLVGLGCCLVMLVSNYFVEVYSPFGSRSETILQIDPARLAYSVMGGIGFLGAGVILKSGLHVRGVTTAATIWCTAAIGLAVGMGMYFHALVTTALVLFALFVLDRVERQLEAQWYKTVEVVLPDTPGMVGEFGEKIQRQPAKIQDIGIERRGDGTLKATYSIRLPDRSHTLEFFDAIAREPEVQYIQLR